MVEGLKTKLNRVGDKIAPYIFVFNDQERGIDFESVFGGEYTTEEWESVFDEYKGGRSLKFGFLGKIVGEAIERDKEGRFDFVDRLTSPAKGILIMEDARKHRKKELAYEQFLINVNSMSETNLMNMQKAINNLQKNG